MRYLENYNKYEVNHFEYNKINFLNLDYKNKKLYNKYKNKNGLKKLRNKKLKGHILDINSGKMSHNLIKPHYFFTYKYNERSMHTQIKHWTSSAYNFLKSEKVENHFKDIYTSKFIKLFFNIKFVNKKSLLSSDMLKGTLLKIKPSLMKTINISLKYTSSRSRLAVVKLTRFPKQLLTLDWIIKYFEFSNIIEEYLKLNKADFSDGYYGKKKLYIRRFKRILISRPLFKHTSFNLIIDLFVYNNKRYIFRRISNISLRRSMYKYMYSMYIDCYEKIKDTMNRPRFFYINLIEPRIHNYYNWIVKYYGELLILKYKPLLLVLYLYLLQANFLKKWKLSSIKKNIINSANKNFIYNIVDNNDNKNVNLNINSLILSNYLNVNIKDKQNIIFKRRSLKNNYYKNTYKYLFTKEYKELYNLKKESLRDMESKYDEIIDQKKKKDIKKLKSKNIKYKKYLADLDIKSNSPIDLKSLSLWNSKGLGKHYRTPGGVVDELSNKLKKKKNSNFSYNNYKKKYLKDYNQNDIFFDSNLGKKKNSDIWYKRRNKLIPTAFQGATDEFFYKKGKGNLNFYSNKNSPIRTPEGHGRININLIPRLKEEQITNAENYEDALDKEQYIQDIQKVRKGSTLLSNAFTSFYYNPSNLNKGNNSISYIKSENVNEINQYVHKENKFQYLKAKDNNRIYSNSKILWDNLDNSILGALSKYVQINNNILSGYNPIEINLLLNDIKKFKGFGNIWYLIYFNHIIKTEYYKVSRDIISTKNFDQRSRISYKKEKTYLFEGNNLIENKVLYYRNKNYKGKLHIWPSFFSNKREENLNFKLGYNENLFKPYYRYMIPIFILNSYYYFCYYIGYLNPLNTIPTYLNKKFNIFNHNNFKLFSFFTVKILLDLLHYNYRSWIRIKANYYYIKRLKFFEKKFYHLTVRSWFIAIRYLKKLRKVPTNFWFRYHKVAGYYFDRVVKNAELDTKRKIFIPFVLYFEDILFSIYGKWVIIRLWPLKKYYLSSYILAKRILLLLLWRRKRVSRKFTIGRISLKLIESLKILEIQKAYNYYIENSTPWPRDLFLKINHSNNVISRNYKDLEFVNTKQERFHFLNSYTLLYNNISSFIPLYGFKYNRVYMDYIKFINNIKYLRKNPSKFTRNEYIYYWVLPFRNYLMKLTRSSDITGIKFQISGRPSFRRSNNRKVNMIYNYGNRLVPKHYSKILDDTISLPMQRLRGYLKPHIESSISISKSRNGSVSLKVWISSLLSIDVHELLLHLVRIKDLYYQLVNRYFSVRKKLRIAIATSEKWRITPHKKRRINPRKKVGISLPLRKKRRITPRNNLQIYLRKNSRITASKRLRIAKRYRLRIENKNKNIKYSPK